MAWPENQKAVVAAGCGHLRASHADREQTVGTLKAAFVQGRLTRGEFDTRIGRALTSRTYAELAAVIADLPAARPPAAPAAPAAGEQRSQVGHIRIVHAALLAVAFALAPLRGDGGYEAAGFVIALVYFVFWLSVGADMLWQWHCACLPTATLCVRCAHTAASHRARASCSVRPGPVTLWGRCACAGYVPPGLAPQAADLDRLAATG